MQLYYPTLTIAALIVWGIGNAYSLKKLQKMQNRAARVILANHMMSDLRIYCKN